MSTLKNTSKKLGILVLCDGMYPERIGGSEIHIFYTCSRLAERGHHVFAISSATKPSNGASVVNIPFEKVTLRLWPMPFATLSYIIGSLIVGLKLKKQTDLVHAHTADFPMVAAFLFSIITNKPYVVSCQGSDIRMSSQKILRRIFQIPFLLNATSIITVSNEIAELLTQKYRIPKRKIRVIGNAYDDRIIQQLTNSGLRADIKKSKNIICVANMRPEKDLITLLKGFERYIKRADAVKLLLVGDGPLREQLEEFCVQHSLYNVEFLGRLPHKDALEHVADSDIFILTSIEEGMPNVIIEALALGKPVIATKVGGIPEIVKNGFNGLLIPSRSPEHIAKALHTLLNDDKLYSELSNNATKSVCEHSWSEIASKYEQMYFNSLNSCAHRCFNNVKS